MSKDSDPRGLSRILKLSLDAAFGTRAQPHAVVDKLQQECKAENAEIPASRSDTVNRRLEVEISHVVFHEGLQNPAGDACGGMVSKSPPVCKSGRGRGRMLVEKSKEPGFLLQNNEELAASNSSESQPDDIHSQSVSNVSAEVAAVADFSAAAVEKDNPENHRVDMVLTNEDNRRLTLKKEDLCELPDLVKCQMRTENSTPRNQQLKAGTGKQELSSHSSTLDCQAFNHKTMAAGHLLPSKSLTPESNTSMGGKYPHGLEKQIKEAVSPSVTPWTDKEKPDCAKVFRGKRTGQQFRAHSRKYFRKRERFSSVIYEGYTEDRPWQTLKQPMHKIYAEAYWDNDKATNKQTQNISFCGSDKRTFRTQPHQLNQGHKGKGKGAKQQAGDVSKTKQQEGNAYKAKQQEGNASKTKQQEGNASKTKQQEGDASKTKQQEGDAIKAKQQERDASKAKQQETDASKAKQQEGNANKVKQHEGGDSKTKQQEGDVSKTKQHEGNASKAKQQEGDASKTKQQKGDVSKAKQQEGNANKAKQQEGDASKTKQQEGDVNKAKQQEGDASKAKQQEGDASKSKQQKGDAIKAKQQDRDSIKAKQHEGDGSKAKPQEGDGEKAKQQDRDSIKAKQCGDISKPKQQDRDSIKAKQWGDYTSKAKQQEGDARKAKQAGDASKAEQQGKEVSKLKQLEGNASKTEQQGEEVSKHKQLEEDAHKAKQQEGDVSKAKQQEGDVNKAKQHEGDVNKAKQHEGDVNKAKQQEGDASKSKQQEGDSSKAKQQEGDPSKAKQQERDASKPKQQEGNVSKAKQQKTNQGKSSQQEGGDIKSKQLEADQRNSDHQKAEASNEFVGCNSSVHTMLNAIYQSYEQEAIEYDDKTAAELPGFNLKFQESKCIEYIPRETSVHSQEKSSLESAAKEQGEGHTVTSIQKGEDSVCVYVERKEVIKSTSGESMGATVCAKEESKNCLSASEQKEVIVCEQSAAAAEEKRRDNNYISEEKEELHVFTPQKKQDYAFPSEEKEGLHVFTSQEKRHDAHASEVNREVKISVSNIRRDTLRNYKDLLVKHVNYETVKINQDLENNLESAPITSQEIQPPSCHVPDNSSKCSTDLPVTVESECSRLCETDLFQNRLQKNSAVHCTSVAPNIMPSQQIMVDQPRESHSNVSEVSRQDNSPFEFSRHPDNYSRPASSYCASEERQGNVSFTPLFHTRELSLPAETVGSEAAMEEVINFLKSCSMDIQQHMSQYNENHPLDMTITVSLTHPPLPDYIPRLPYHGHPCLGDRPRMPCPPPIFPYSGHPCHGDRPRLPCPPPIFPYPGHPYHGDRPRLPYPPPFFPYPGWFPAHPFSWNWWPWFERYSANISPYIGYIPPPFTCHPPTVQPVSPKDNDPPPLDASNLLPSQSDGNGQGPAFSRAHADHFSPKMYSRWNPAVFDRQQEPRRAYSYTEELPLGRPEFWTPEMAANHPNGNAEGGDNSVTMSQTSQNVAEEEKWNDRDSRASSEPLAESVTAASTASQDSLRPRRRNSASSVISSVSNRSSKSRGLLSQRFQTLAAKRKSAPYHMTRPWKAHQTLKRRRQSCPSAVNMSAAKQYSKPEEKKRLKSETGLLLSPNDIAGTKCVSGNGWAVSLVARSRSYTHKFIDSHCHIDYLYGKLEILRETLFSTFQKQSAWMFPSNYEGCVAVFCNPNTFNADNPKDHILHSVSTEDGIWLAVGCHPKYAEEFTDAHLRGLRNILKHPKVVALGEIGLDYSGTFQQYSEVQKLVFRQQIQLALELNLPIVVHCRDADDDCLEILTQMVPSDYKIHAHCFTRDISTALRWITPFPNLFLGLTPLVTYKTPLDALNTATFIPLDRLLLETDAPFFLPSVVHYKDMRCSHPGFALYVAEKVAELKHITVNEVLKACRENTKKMYGI